MSMMSMMRELEHQIGRFKVRRLMKDAGLMSRQPGSHAYKVARLSDLISRIGCA